MTQPITLESLYSLLSGFIQRQELFNSKQEAFNTAQLGFNARIEDKLDRYQEESRSNHHLSHKMILQAFEYISDIRRDIDECTEPWRKK